jgi:DNA recombination protein RmuC
MPDLLLISLFIVTVILALVCLVLWAKVARLSERASRIPELETQAERLKDDLRAAHADIVVLNSRLSESEARREAERKASDQKVALLTGAREEFGVQFENLANRIFDDKSRKFTEQNKLNLESLLTPLGTQIKEFRERVDVVYEKESQQRVSLQTEIGRLRDLNERMDRDAIELTNALKGQSKTLGNWGEFVLEDILQKAGLVKDREYVMRETLISEDGKRSQPDVIVMLPEDRHLVIDSKANLSSYQRYCSAESEVEAKQELKNHIAAIRKHLRELDVKSYQDHYQLNSLDFVLMFIPLEPAFIVAVREDPTVYDDAFHKRIVIVCPSTLLATMRTVGNIWRQEYQKRNVLEIANQAGGLYDKFVGFVDDLESIGERLGQAQASYEAAHSKLSSGRGNLVRRAEQIVQLGAKASKRLPPGLVAAGTEIEEISDATSIPPAETAATTLIDGTSCEHGFEEDGLHPQVP